LIAVMANITCTRHAAARVSAVKTVRGARVGAARREQPLDQGFCRSGAPRAAAAASRGFLAARGATKAVGAGGAGAWARRARRAEAQRGARAHAQLRRAFWRPSTLVFSTRRMC
jgi:hypothetical protein